MKRLGWKEKDVKENIIKQLRKEKYKKNVRTVDCNQVYGQEEYKVYGQTILYYAEYQVLTL